MFVVSIAFFVSILLKCEAAKVLAVFTAPSISHQIVFRPFTQELVKRGHEVTVVTTDPAFAPGKTPENLTEIDTHDLLYTVIRTNYSGLKIAEKVSFNSQFDGIFSVINNICEAFFKSDVIEKLREEKYDLLITEALHKMVLPLSNMLEVPIMQISSFGSMFDYETVGASTHPTLYPEITSNRIHNLTTLEKLHEISSNVMIHNNMYHHEDLFWRMLKRLNINTPSLADLRNKVTTMLLNVQPIWEENRPVPFGVSYIGGVRPLTNHHSMSKELQKFLDSSKKAVIYVSFGTNVHPSLLPTDKIEVLMRGLSMLPYDVLLKWDREELVNKPANVKIGKWFPQIAVLGHPNVKLFITQCGLQSTEEAIDAGVPLIGIPFMFDQWANAEKYVRHRLGLKLNIESLTEQKLKNAVDMVISDKRYRENVARFRTLMRDQPHTPLETAVWWTEYAIRYSGAPHLRSAAANLPWTQYFEVELLFIVLFTILVTFSALVFLFNFIWRYIVTALKSYLNDIRINLKIKNN